MRTRYLMRGVLGLVLMAPALSMAQETETEATVRAYAAGYKAHFTCAASFNGGKTLAQIKAHELTGIYPLVADLVAQLPDAEIDAEKKRVSVHYDPDMPPRISQWRPHLGCVQLPVGAEASAAAYLPAIDLPEPDARTDDGAPWQKKAPINGESGHQALDKVMRAAIEGDARYGADALTSAVMVATPEAILSEHYIEGFTPTTSQRTWSVAKSIAASVLGAAVQQGMLEVKAPATIPEWSHPADPRRAITLENLLHMASGLDSNQAGNRTDRLYMGGGAITDTATEYALEAPPGKRWKYANNDTLLSVRALRGAMGDDAAFLRFPFETLLYKIGMTHTSLETDWRGDFVLSSQVWTTARDLARLGVLYLNDGVWDGERILPEGWAKYVATPAPGQPPLDRGGSGVSPGYGAQWWLYNERFPDIPNDSFAALGNRGQYLVVIPSRNLVIIRRGYDPARGDRFKLDVFIRDVLAAIKE
ncbi:MULTISPECIES: serine hydrolase [unclassified Iodidimonas]|uniref:serine hydrolase domain-containing protein n=1 Tax=unclassified Iodidimonas TaxID=2626145 RepID=UPI0024825CB6|nr:MULTISPECIES: serine hydrolase [unclassified Iodidimonas]